MSKLRREPKNLRTDLLCQPIAGLELRRALDELRDSDLHHRPGAGAPTANQARYRFPVGYYPLHPNLSLKLQMNRFWNWVGDTEMLEELRAVGPRIADYDDWPREMFDLGDRAFAAGRRLPAAYYSMMATWAWPSK